jgi:hypothetical protein
VDSHFEEGMYISPIQTRPTLGDKVVHHFDTNLVEDVQADPIGLFLSEYAVGKGADVYPTDTGRLVKAGSPIHFQIHMHSDTVDTPVSVAVGLRLYPKGVVPKYVAFTQHMGNNSTALDIEPGQIARTDGYFRLPKAAVLTAFQPHFHTLGRAMCVEAIYPDVRADSARPGPARTETISCVSSCQYGWSLTYPYAEDVSPLLSAGTLIHVTMWHDNTNSNLFGVNPIDWVGDGQRRTTKWHLPGSACITWTTPTINSACRREKRRPTKRRSRLAFPKPPSTENGRSRRAAQASRMTSDLV